jgi:hypothetical protein
MQGFLTVLKLKVDIERQTKNGYDNSTLVATDRKGRFS